MEKSQSLELASVSAVALLLELLPESQGQCTALEKETCEYFHWISQAPPKEGAFPGHELASVCVGSRSCTFDLKVILANAEVRDVTVPKGRVEGFLLLRLFLDEEGVPKPPRVLCGGDQKCRAPG